MSQSPNQIIVLATHNADKRKEIIPLMEPLGITIHTLLDYPEVGEIIEDGETLKDNALIKARTVHQSTGLPTIADDTGLSVDFLDGGPGVYTGRFAGEKASYDENVDKLLKVMTSVPEPERTARFVTVIAYVNSRQELTAEGFVEGRIASERKGVGGFGYDPVFYIPFLNKTFAEMTTKEKSTISHRGRAFQNMKRLLLSHKVISPRTHPQTNHRS